MAQIINNDDQYWTRLKMGDPEALGYLYDSYAESLFLFAMRITDNRELAKDALQEVFIECWNYRETLGAIRHSQSYLSKVLRNILVKKLKARQVTGHLQAAESLACPAQNREDSLILQRDCTLLESEQAFTDSLVGLIWSYSEDVLQLTPASQTNQIKSKSSTNNHKKIRTSIAHISSV